MNKMKNNREIKFRVIWNNEVYGYEALNDGLWQNRLANATFLKDECWFKGVFVFGGKNLKTVIRNQFTGLKDKNNKEIYEGDILNVYDFRLSRKPITKVVIKWLDGGLHAFMKLNDEYPIEEGYTLNHEIGNTHEFNEIIGNIFENPKLLT